MRNLSKWAGAVVALVLLAGTSAAADAVAAGKVKTINADKKAVVLTDADGKDATFKLGDNVVINRDGKDYALDDAQLGSERAKALLIVPFADHHVMQRRKFFRELRQRTNPGVLTFVWHQSGDSSHHRRVANAPFLSQASGISTRCERVGIGAEIERSDWWHFFHANLLHHIARQIGNPR